MGIDYCSDQEKSYIVSLFASTPRDVDIKPLYTYLCPVIIFICFFSVLFNAILMGISRQSKVVNKSPILLLSLNLAVTDLIASLMNGLGILFNSYLPEVHDIKTGECWMLIFEVIRCAALVASALHLLALAIVHYRGIVNPLHYRSTIFFSQHLSRTINIISIVCWIIPLTIMLVEFSATPCQGFQTANCEYFFLMGFTFRYILLTSFALPLVVMVVIYLRIFTIISKHQKGCRQNHIERGSALTRGVISASGPVGSAAAMNLLQLMENSASAAAAAAPKSDAAMDLRGRGCQIPPQAKDEEDESRVCSISSCKESTQTPRVDSTVAFAAAAAAEERPGNRSETGQAKERKYTTTTSTGLNGSRPLADDASANIKLSLANMGGSRNGPINNSSILVVENRLVESREARDHGEMIGIMHNDNTDCDHRELLRVDDSGDKIHESLLVEVGRANSIAPARLEHGPKLVGKRANNRQVCDKNDKNNNSGPADSPLVGPNMSRDTVNDGLDKGLTANAAAAAANRGLPSTQKFISPLDELASGGKGPTKLADKPDDCRPSSSCSRERMVAAGGGGRDDGSGSSGGDPPSELLGCGNPPRSTTVVSETHRGDSCKGKPPRVALRTQFSLKAQLFAPPISPRPTAGIEQQPKLPTKSSLKHSKQQNLISDQKRQLNGSGTTKGSDSHESTWECSECDNKLRQLSVRLAHDSSTTSPGDGGDGDSEQVSMADGHPGDGLQGTLVTMSVTSQGSHGRSAMSSSTTVHMTSVANLDQKRPKLCRSMTATGGDSPQHQECHFTGSISGQTNQSDNDMSRVMSNNTRTLTSAGSVASGSYYEPQRRHIHASAVPQTNTKALVTTLLILGTYFISYVPAIMFQVLTCIDNCPYPLYTIPFSRRVLLGSITTLLVIAKSIIDPLIYSYRMSEVQVAIHHYMSKRRSKSSIATSMLQTSQRHPATSAGGGTSIYNNNNSVPVDSKQPATNNQRSRPSLNSLRMLKQYSNTSDYHRAAAGIRSTNSSTSESPSKARLAKRFQSFDKHDYYCPTSNAAVEKVPLSNEKPSTVLDVTPTSSATAESSSSPSSTSSPSTSTSINSQPGKEDVFFKLAKPTIGREGKPS